MSHVPAPLLTTIMPKTNAFQTSNSKLRCTYGSNSSTARSSTYSSMMHTMRKWRRAQSTDARLLETNPVHIIAARTYVTHGTWRSLYRRPAYPFDVQQVVQQQYQSVRVALTSRVESKQQTLVSMGSTSNPMTVVYSLHLQDAYNTYDNRYNTCEPAERFVFLSNRPPFSRR